MVHDREDPNLPSGTLNRARTSRGIALPDCGSLVPILASLPGQIC